MSYTITAINVYNCSPGHLGAGVTDAAAAGYREWLAAELTAEFPGVEINVSDEPSTYSTRVEIEGDEEYLPGGFVRHQDDVEQFLAAAWDRCPWDWA